MDVNKSTSAPPAGTEPPAISTGQVPELRKQILEHVVPLTKSAPPPKNWPFVGRSNTVRRLHDEPDVLARSLQDEFTREQLIASRVVVAGPDNVLRLSRVFGDATSCFAIRRDATGGPIDAISSHGMISGAARDWLRLAAEQAETINNHELPVLLVFDNDDLPIVHRLNCRFTSAASIERLTGQRVRELFAARGVHRQQRRHSLIVPCWQMAKCTNEPAPNVLRALKHLVKIETVFGYDPSTVFFAWLPSADEFRGILSAWSFADWRAVGQRLLASLCNSRFSPADALRLMDDAAERDYGFARNQLQRVIDSSHLAPRAAEARVAFAKLEKAYQTATVNKFPTHAGSDPWNQLRSKMASELAQGWFEQLGVVKAARKLIAGEFPGCDVFDEQLFNRQLRIVGTFAKLYGLKSPK